MRSRTKEIDPRRATIPLVEERLVVRKRRVASGRVRIRTVLEEKPQLVQECLEREDASIERVPVGREVDAPPEWRREGDVLVIPLVEEVLVCERKVILKEELHVRLRKSSEPFSTTVNLRSTRAVVERTPLRQPAPRRGSSHVRRRGPARER